jgi:hypothetical protein
LLVVFGVFSDMKAVAVEQLKGAPTAADATFVAPTVATSVDTTMSRLRTAGTSTARRQGLGVGRPRIVALGGGTSIDDAHCGQNRHPHDLRDLKAISSPLGWLRPVLAIQDNSTELQVTQHGPAGCEL